MAYYHNYITSEVFNSEPYTLSSDIYSYDKIIIRKAPFYERRRNINLALEVIMDSDQNLEK